MTTNHEEESKIVLTDEEGGEHEFNLVDVISVEGKEYAILQPDGDDEAIILKFEVDDNGDEFLSEVENDEEWERVADLWQETIENEDED